MKFILKCLLTLGVIGLLALAIMVWVYDRNYTEGQFLLNAFFVPGVLTFFIGLLSLTNATEIFKATGYALGTMFKGRIGVGGTRYQNFYKNRDPKNKNHDKTTGLPVLLMGGLVTIVCIVIAYMYYV